METPTPHNFLVHSFSQLLEAIDLCIRYRLRGPALILLYSGIDIAGSLDSDEQSVQRRFTRWIDNYLLLDSALDCTAADLYGARCGLVHTYSPTSALSKAGKALEIGYAWKPDTAAELKKLVLRGAELKQHLGQEPMYFVAIQGDDLIESFRQGVVRFLNELERDPDRAAAAYAKSGHFISDLPSETAAEMLKKAEAVLGRG